jgi:bifunctional non-homologous end joining protein LigD
LPLADRKKRLARLVGKRRLGIVLSGHTADDGATIFRQACRMGLEGIVSKRLGAPYRSGPSRDWLKVKNPGTGSPSGDAMAQDASRCDRS